MAARKKSVAKKPVRKAAVSRGYHCERCGRDFRTAAKPGSHVTCPECGSEDVFDKRDGTWPCSGQGCNVNRHGEQEKINYGGLCRACRAGKGPVKIRGFTPLL